MYLKPIESIPINWNRPRLKYLVPLEELIKLLHFYKKGNCKLSENVIKRYTKATINEADSIFAKDILDFCLLLYEYNSGFYVITKNSKKALSKRLNVSYNDGIEFNFFLKIFKDEKILKEEPRFIQTEEKTLEVIFLTKEISETFDIEIQSSI